MNPSLRGALALVFGTWLAALPTVSAQVEIDRDRAAQPLRTIRPNGTFRGNPAHIVRGVLDWSDSVVRIEGSGQSRCDLVIEDGGQLTIENCDVGLRGDYMSLDGAEVKIRNSRFSQMNSVPREFSYWFEGGHLDTENVSIGGDVDTSGRTQFSNFRLDRGLWTCRDTVVRDSAGIVMGLRGGHHGDPGLKGGTLIADGLFQGRNSDALMMLGEGNAIVRNSTFAINLFFYAERAGTLDLDLATDQPIVNRVYGDPTVHDAYARPAITHALPGSPWRLEIVNTHVPAWIVQVSEVTTNGPPFNVDIRNGSDVFLRVLTDDLQGRPALTGPWRQYYPSPARLPELPSSTHPGEHPIPPGCGVRIGNVTFRSAPNNWTNVRGWAFNFVGAGTTFAIRGATRIAEIFVYDANITFEGDHGYNADLSAVTYYLHGASRMTIRNATVGVDSNTQAEISVEGGCQVSLDNVILKNILFKTRPGRWHQWRGVDQNTITVDNFVEEGVIRTSPSPGSSISLQRATASQDIDLQNLDFEAAVQSNGLPSYWSGSGVNGYRSTSRRGISPGVRSFGYRTSSSSGWIHKRMGVAPGTPIEWSGWVYPRNVPAGAQLRFELRGSSGARERVDVPIRSGVWTYVHTRPYEVRSNDTAVEFRITHANVNGTLDVLIDDCDARFGRWWEHTDLANTDFEGQYRDAARRDEPNAPDHWEMFLGRSVAEVVDVRPGAASGSRATRIDVPEGEFRLFKILPWVEPGNTIEVTGWVKALPHPSGPYSVWARVSEANSDWWKLTYGNNVGARIASGSWQQFTLNYTVPAGATRADASHIAFSGPTPNDAVVLIDDVQVTIR